MKTAIFSLVIAISVALLSLFQFEKYQKLSQSTHSEITKLENKLKTSQDSFNVDFARLKEQEQHLLNRAQDTSWQIAEIQYLAHLAETRIKFARDVKSALTLLTIAEQKLQKLNNPDLKPLQIAVAKDLEILQNITLPDLEELWLKASALIEQTASLPLRAISLSSTQPNSERKKDTTGPKTWKQAFLDSLQELKDLVKIRHYSKPIDPELSETQQVLVKENLRLLLEQIRFAILTSEQKIYQQAIQDCVKWLTKYYDDTHSEVKNSLSTLATLEAINLRPELPQMISLEQFNSLR